MKKNIHKIGKINRVSDKKKTVSNKFEKYFQINAKFCVRCESGACRLIKCSI